MPVGVPPSLEAEIVGIVKWIAGRKTVELDQLIGRDVGIYGGDGVELLDELEERYGVPLDRLIKQHRTFLPPRWFDRLLGRSQGPANVDLTVRQLIDYIRGELQRRNSSAEPDDSSEQQELR